MLVLSRQVGERILIGDNIAVTVVRIAQGVVRIGVEAPSNVAIVREEIIGKPTTGCEGDRAPIGAP
ncbi:MAG: carbon storage regulator [Thermoguttaceae bacterium]|nr:carbon storage regulator [Thermoguttaceae bacterium]